jgi:hypothetical protein
MTWADELAASPNRSLADDLRAVTLEHGVGSPFRPSPPIWMHPDDFALATALATPGITYAERCVMFERVRYERRKREIRAPKFSEAEWAEAFR